MPFPLLELHSDDGSEFLNGHLRRWCRQTGILPSCSRPEHGNGNCHVEQNNWAVVRRLIGCQPLDSPDRLPWLGSLCGDLLRPYNICFPPVMQLTGQESVGHQIRKHHDQPTPPPKRGLDSDQAGPLRIRELAVLYTTASPLTPSARPTAAWPPCPPPWDSAIRGLTTSAAPVPASCPPDSTITGQRDSFVIEDDLPGPLRPCGRLPQAEPVGRGRRARHGNESVRSSVRPQRRMDAVHPGPIRPAAGAGAGAAVAALVLVAAATAGSSRTARAHGPPPPPAHLASSGVGPHRYLRAAPGPFILQAAADRIALHGNLRPATVMSAQLLPAGAVASVLPGDSVLSPAVATSRQVWLIRIQGEHVAQFPDPLSPAPAFHHSFVLVAATTGAVLAVGSPTHHTW